MNADRQTDGIHGELSHAIIGAAMTVLNALRPGLDEKLYERALVIELRQRGFRVDQQRKFPVSYRGEQIGVLVPDLIVNERVVVDPKVVDAFSESHVAQMLGYLATTELKLALLVNFRNASLQVRRVIRA